MGGRRRLAFRVDAFNALNHTQFDAVANNVQFQSLANPRSDQPAVRRGGEPGADQRLRRGDERALAARAAAAGPVPVLRAGPGRWTRCPALDSACPVEVRSLTGRGAVAPRPVRVSDEHAQDRPHQLPGRDQRNGAPNQPSNRAQPDSTARTAVPGRSGPTIRPAAQHGLGHHRRADRRGLGQRRRARAPPARPPAALPARQHRAGRHHRRRAAARAHDGRPGRPRRAVQGPGAVEHPGDARRPSRRGSPRRSSRSAPNSRRRASKASASACPAASMRKGT